MHVGSALLLYMLAPLLGVSATVPTVYPWQKSCPLWGNSQSYGVVDAFCYNDAQQLTRTAIVGGDCVYYGNGALSCDPTGRTPFFGGGHCDFFAAKASGGPIPLLNGTCDSILVSFDYSACLKNTNGVLECIVPEVLPAGE